MPEAAFQTKPDVAGNTAANEASAVPCMCAGIYAHGPNAYKHVWMYTCVCVDVHTCIHIYIHTYIHAYIHTYIPAYIHACKHAYMHTYIHIPTYIQNYACLYKHTQACMQVCMHVCRCACTYVCVYVQAQTLSFCGTLEPESTTQKNDLSGCTNAGKKPCS